MAQKRLRDIDSHDNMVLLSLAIRVGPPVMMLLLGIEFWFWGNHFFLFVIPDLAATALIVLAARWALDSFGTAVGSIFFPSGAGTPTGRQYSEQESLIARGRFLEAADSYRAIIGVEPVNIEARMRLGRLLENDLRDYAGAEEAYRRIRGLSPTKHEDWLVSNALIDLYQASGEQEKLKAELSRLSRQYQGTEIGTNARRRLDEIKESDAAPSST